MFKAGLQCTLLLTYALHLYTTLLSASVLMMHLMRAYCATSCAAWTAGVPWLIQQLSSALLACEDNTACTVCIGVHAQQAVDGCIAAQWQNQGQKQWYQIRKQPVGLNSTPLCWQ